MSKQLAGTVGVDTGRLLIIDPAYLDVLPTDKEELYKLFNCAGEMSKQLNFDNGRAGLGVIVETGYGDGLYDVEIRTGVDDVGSNLVKALRIKFIK